MIKKISILLMCSLILFTSACKDKDKDEVPELPPDPMRKVRESDYVLPGERIVTTEAAETSVIARKFQMEERVNKDTTPLIEDFEEIAPFLSDMDSIPGILDGLLYNDFIEGVKIYDSRYKDQGYNSVAKPLRYDIKAYTERQRKNVLWIFDASWSSYSFYVQNFSQDLADKYSEELIVIVIDFNAQKELAEEYSVISVPEFILFEKLHIVDTFSGAGDGFENRVEDMLYINGIMKDSENDAKDSTTKETIILEEGVPLGEIDNVVREYINEDIEEAEKTTDATQAPTSD